MRNIEHPAPRPLVAKVVGATALVGAMLLPAVSTAQTAGGLIDESAGFYIGGGLGRADLDNPCPGPSSLVNCDDDGTVWKLYGGWQLNKWLAAELGYINFPDADFRGQTSGGAGLRGDVETWGITAHAVGKIPVPIGALDRLSILGKIGTIWYDRERNANLSAYDNDDNGFAWAWGFGAEYTFSERIGMRAEWERFENVGDSGSGKGDIDAWTLSVNYKF